MRNLKRALSLAVASVMLFGMMVVGSSAASYPDVDVADNLEAIEVLKMVGIMEGDESGKFNPDKMVTRNEMAVVMVNLLGLTPGGSCPFNDVPSWAQPYVAACYNNGIIAGVSATEFNGDANVTAVQAGLMVMKALGYFGYQGEFGDSWKLAVVKQADEIDLYRGVNAYTDQDMSRNNVAQMVLNALECTVMVVREQGGLNVEGNGISVNQRPTYEKTPADNRDNWDYALTSDPGYGIDGDQWNSLQLCEKLYGKSLKKDDSGTVTDDYGRPATEWAYESKSVTSPNEPNLTYTTEVKAKTVYTDLNKGKFTAGSGSADEYIRVTDGVNSTPGFDIAKNEDDDNKFGGQGVLTEVYYNSSSDSVTVVEINTYLAEVTKVVENDDDYTVTVRYRSASLPGNTKKTFDTEEEFAKEDMVLVTIYGDDSSPVNYSIGSMAEAKTASGEVTAARSDTSKLKTYIKLDGEQYQIAEKFYNLTETDDTLPDVDSKVDVYLDAYGNVIGSDGRSVADDYLYVISAQKDLDCVVAKVLFSDATIAKIDITKYTATDGTTVRENEAIIMTGGTPDIDTGMVFAYSEDDGEYAVEALKQAASASSTEKREWYEFKTTATEPPVSGQKRYVITKGNSNIAEQNYTSDWSSKAVMVTTDNATVFVDKENEVAYTGYKSVPGMEGVSLIAIYDDDDVAEVIFITKGSDSNVDSRYFFAKNDNHEKRVDGSKTFRTYEETYVNGVKENITTKNISASNIVAGMLYEIKKIDSDEYVTSVAPFADIQNVVGTGVADTDSNGKNDVVEGCADMTDKATYAEKYTLKLATTDSDQATSANKQEFTYNDDTVFMTVELKLNKDDEYEVDSVYEGDAGDIVIENADHPEDQNASGVYVISVDDKNDVTPLATLVLVITPPQP